MANTKSFIVIAVFLASLILVSAASFIYDDFSGGSLDTSKWQEIPGSDLNNLFVDEHYVDTTQEVYHTAQLSPADRGVTLEILQHTFKPGERVEFDLYYTSGTGNRVSYLDIDGSTKWWGLIGYWNEVQQGGNDFGKYHITVEFAESGGNISVIRPDLTEVNIHSFPWPAGNMHSFGFGTRTGHNGVVHMDYDNVVITTIEDEEDCDCGDLEERVEQLEQEVEELKEELEEQRNILTVLEESFDNFVDYINKLLSGLPGGLRKQMVCNTLEVGESTTALGLFCEKTDKKCICKQME